MEIFTLMLCLAKQVNYFLPVMQTVVQTVKDPTQWTLKLWRYRYSQYLQLETRKYDIILCCLLITLTTHFWALIACKPWIWCCHLRRTDDGTLRGDVLIFTPSAQQVSRGSSLHSSASTTSRLWHRLWLSLPWQAKTHLQYFWFCVYCVACTLCKKIQSLSTHNCWGCCGLSCRQRVVIW